MTLTVDLSKGQERNLARIAQLLGTSVEEVAYVFLVNGVGQWLDIAGKGGEIDLDFPRANLRICDSDACDDLPACVCGK